MGSAGRRHFVVAEIRVAAVGDRIARHAARNVGLGTCRWGRAAVEKRAVVRVAGGKGEESIISGSGIDEVWFSG